MSRVPYSPNQLSPWPRVLYRDEDVDADASHGLEAESKISAGPNGNGGYPTLAPQPRKGSLSNVGFAKKARPMRGRRSSFGSTQQQVTVAESFPVKPLDREKSGQEVQRLLKLRKQKLKEAKENGGDTEAYRLKHLNLFDDMEKPETKDDGFEDGVLEGPPNKSDVVYEIASPITELNVLVLPSPAFSHGHGYGHGQTLDLCCHMKLQQAHGASVPKVSSSSTIDPELGSSTTASAGSSSTLAHSPKSSTSSTQGSSSPRTRASTLESFIDNSSVTCSPSKVSSASSEAGEEDSFLYIANYIRYHSRNMGQGKSPKPQGSAIAAPETRRESSSHCTCSDHDCRTYLSGTSSQHCRNCKLPRPQPEIRAVLEHIEDVKASAVSANDPGILIEENGFEVELAQDEDLRDDVELVELYNAEMEKRCSKGVWWEGWLVVEELKRQGIMGSKPYVYGTADMI